jgi:hypothetical protein
MDKESKKKARPQPVNSPEKKEQQDAVFVVFSEKKRRGKRLQRAEFRDHKGDRMKALSLRLPQDLAAAIDWELKQKVGRVSRNTFMVDGLSYYVQFLQDRRARQLRQSQKR